MFNSGSKPRANGGGAAPAKPANAGSNNVEDIPREELMSLCMKLNKRMQQMEGKGKELVRKKTSLLNERHLLFDYVITAVNSSNNSAMSTLTSALSTMNARDNEGDLDLAAIANVWKKWEQHRSDDLVNLEQKILQNEVHIASLEGRLKKEKAANGGTGGASGATATATPGDKEDLMSFDSSSSFNDEQLASMIELQTKCRKQEAEIDRLRNKEASIKEQLNNADFVNADKKTVVERLQKELEAVRLKGEEKVLDIQMLNKSIAKSKEENKDKDKEVFALKKQMEKMTMQISAVQVLNEEKEISVKSNREMIQALQNRLMEIEPELSSAKEKIRDHERHRGASTMMKAEADALLQALRKDLKSAIDEREKIAGRLTELEEFKVNAEGQLLRMQTLRKLLHELETSEETKASLIKRMQSEAQTGERSHAMRTALLATVEAQLAEVQAELKGKQETESEIVAKVHTLQVELSETHKKLQEKKRELEDKCIEMTDTVNEERRQYDMLVNTLKIKHNEALEGLKRDHAKKSAMARTLLSEREEDVRILTAKTSTLQGEITSGAPTERKIFELASVQAKRDAVHHIHNDTRQLAFERIQTALADRDLELARCADLLNELSVEAGELRRTRLREGVNMDYLKNIVVQYMSFPVQSSEKISLIPVIAMLLQFTAKELTEVNQANREAVNGGSIMSIWTSSLGSPDILITKPAKPVAKPPMGRSPARSVNGSVESSIPNKGGSPSTKGSPVTNGSLTPNERLLHDRLKELGLSESLDAETGDTISRGLDVEGEDDEDVTRLEMESREGGVGFPILHSATSLSL